MPMNIARYSGLANQLEAIHHIRAAGKTKLLLDEPLAH